MTNTAAWEERTLGADEAYVKKAPKEIEAKIDDAIGLQMISIRLEKELIDDFKLIGKYHGLGYQPIMRDALRRFAHHELQSIVKGVVEPQHSTESVDQTQKRPRKKPIKKAA